MLDHEECARTASEEAEPHSIPPAKGRKKPARKREAISKRTRFEIFNRDGFTCRYCGGQSDQVKLVIDHIKPVCSGGTNDPTNLITSCESCNQGKAGNQLKNTTQIEAHRLALAQEFRELNAISVAAIEAQRLSSELRQSICNEYCEVFGVSEMNTDSLVRYVSMCKQVGPELLFSWFQIAAKRLCPGSRDVDILRYIYGIRRNYMEEHKDVR